MFIATANVLDTIPGPVRDRMEVIELPGYTEDEKLEIARRYLLKRQLEANGLTRRAVRDHRGRHPRRSSATTRARPACAISSGRSAPSAATSPCASPKAASSACASTARQLPAILGPRRFENEVAMRTSVPGVATGLAWTPVGGDILFIEATRVPGRGKLILTGQLGDVMKESAQAALTLVEGARAATSASTPACSRSPTCTSTCPPAPSPRTARARASRCSWRSSRCSPAAPRAATWR